MKSLPDSDDTLLIRTDFSDQEGWEALWTAVTTPNEDDFVANVHRVDDPAYRDVTAEQFAALLNPLAFLIVADKLAITSPERPLLSIYRDGEGRTGQLRVIAEELWSVENNISLSNMEWAQFTESVDDGIFRGFF